MATLDTFLVTCNGVGEIDVDFVDPNTDPDEHIVYAFVDFIPRLPKGFTIWASGLTPPRGIILNTVRGRFSDQDGKLRTIVGAPQNERQHVVVSGSPTSFTLSLSGAPTASITAAGITNATIKDALEAVPSIGFANIAVTGAYPSFNVQFVGTLATANVAQLTGTTTGGTGAAVTVTTLDEGDGELGVKLIANTAVLDLDDLVYDVKFTIPESETIINGFAIQAPTTAGQTIDLTTATRLPLKEGL